MVLLSFSFPLDFPVNLEPLGGFGGICPFPFDFLSFSNGRIQAMKIIDRKAFLALPAGVLFSKYQPCLFDVLTIKGDTWAHCNDFLVQQIADGIDCAGSEDFAAKCQLMEEGISAGMDFDCLGRDGCFDEDQLFAVWEASDLSALIERLQQCVGAP